MKLFWLLFLGAAALTATNAQADDDKTINKYVLRAVEQINAQYGGQGYGLSAFTHDLQFGDDGILPAGNAPLTMCVAAQLEVLVEALNLYAKETGDFSPFHFLPKISWQRLRPVDLRGQIWVVDHATSYGAADAFTNFGMGDRSAFKDLRPGDFLNFNRTDRSGHGVVFLSFLDRAGTELPEYSGEVAGFKYFSSNGIPNRPGGGFGLRWAFFSDVACPNLDPAKKRDCGVIRSDNPNFLVPGSVRHPRLWDRAKAARQLFRMQESAGDPILGTDGMFRADFFTGRTTDD